MENFISQVVLLFSEQPAEAATIAGAGALLVLMLTRLFGGRKVDLQKELKSALDAQESRQVDTLRGEVGALLGAVESAASVTSREVRTLLDKRGTELGQQIAEHGERNSKRFAVLEDADKRTQGGLQAMQSELQQLRALITQQGEGISTVATALEQFISAVVVLEPEKEVINENRQASENTVLDRAVKTLREAEGAQSRIEALQEIAALLPRHRVEASEALVEALDDDRAAVRVRALRHLKEHLSDVSAAGVHRLRSILPDLIDEEMQDHVRDAAEELSREILALVPVTANGGYH